MSGNDFETERRARGVCVCIHGVTRKQPASENLANRLAFSPSYPPEALPLPGARGQRGGCLGYLSFLSGQPARRRCSCSRHVACRRGRLRRGFVTVRRFFFFLKKRQPLSPPPLSRDRWAWPRLPPWPLPFVARASPFPPPLYLAAGYPGNGGRGGRGRSGEMHGRPLASAGCSSPRHEASPPPQHALLRTAAAAALGRGGEPLNGTRQGWTVATRIVCRCYLPHSRLRLPEGAGMRSEEKPEDKASIVLRVSP